NASGIWTASYKITEGMIDAASRNVSITVTDNAGNAAVAFDTSNLTVDNLPPTITDAHISITSTGSGPGGVYRVGDKVTARWDNPATGDNNADGLAVSNAVAVNFSQFGAPRAFAALSAGGIWTASYTITSGTIDAGNRNIAVTVTDNAGNLATASDTSNLSVD